MHRWTTRVALSAATVVGLPLMSNSATMSRQFGSLISLPGVSSGSAGNDSVDSPVIAVNDVFDDSP